MLEKLKSLFGEKPAPAPVKKVGSGTAKSANSAVSNRPQGQSNTQAPQRRQRAVPKNARTREEMTIHRQEKIPKYEKVLSVEGGEVYLPQNLRNDYIVLKLHGDDNRIVIISSLEKAETPGVDNDFAALLDQCKSRGYRLAARFFAKSQIIQIAYQDANARSKGKNTDEIADPKSYQVAFDKLIKKAIDEKISDIHIEVLQDNAIVRNRIDGSLLFGEPWLREYAIEMAIVIYQVIAEEKDVTFKMNEPQSAVIVRNIDGKQVRVRLNTLPSYPNGFDMILRVFLEGAENHRRLDESGYYPEQLEIMDEAASDPTGVVIIAGTTGSGKSTTVAAILSERIAAYTYNGSSSIKVITVEDPPENAIKFTTQVPVVRSRKLEEGESAFSPYIRAAMRSDPDVLMVGEVRDTASAELLMSAVQSGHAVITTIHAPSAIGIMARLRSRTMGLPNDVLGGRDFISGLIYQSLIPCVCKKCSIPYDQFKASTDDRKSLQMLERLEKITTEEERKGIVFKNHEGCDACHQGIKGRIVIAETIRPNDEMKKLFSQGKDFEALQLFYRQGGKPIQYYGYRRVLEGVVDARDVEKKLGRMHREWVFEHEKAFVDHDSEFQQGFEGNAPSPSPDYEFKSKLFNEEEKKAEIKRLRLVKDEQNSDEVTKSDVNDNVDDPSDTDS